MLATTIGIVRVACCAARAWASTAGRSAGGAVFGVIYADRRAGGRPFGEAELGLLAAAAQQAGSLARRIGEEDRLRDENRGLIRSATAVNSSAQAATCRCVGRPDIAYPRRNSWRGRF